MTDDHPYIWMESYRAAMVEPDPGKLQNLLVTAQRAVQERIRQLMPDLVDHSVERRALEDALQNLRVVEREVRKDLYQPPGSASQGKAPAAGIKAGIAMAACLSP